MKMKIIWRSLIRMVTAYMVIGFIIALIMSVAAKEFSIDSFTMIVLIWPLVVLFWLAFNLAG
jgi:hypothetical protein